MSISIFDLFSIGIGPSSSHTVGPMRAAFDFCSQLETAQFIPVLNKIKVEVYGSLALTGVGHGTDRAILNGLEGMEPESVSPECIIPRMQNIIKSNELNVFQKKIISFKKERDLIFHQKEVLPKHTNGMKFFAYDKQDKLIFSEIYYSIGGGFIVTQANYGKQISDIKQPYAFHTANDLLELSKQHKLTISQIMLANESVWQSEQKIKAKLLNIASVMENCIKQGCQTKGILPGGLEVKRRASYLYDKLMQRGHPKAGMHADIMNWLNVFAIAVNEENAAGGRIVTAPTNGAAGIIPAVLQYYKDFCNDADEDGVINYLLTAGAIAILYKKNASISGAEVGCQGEVGTASSMAAGALAAVLGGSTMQIENAAEIAMEHHLGMTCDPVNGLVQIPCIERNAMGAVKSVNAARLALLEEGDHKVPLDKVIKTMFETGRDMMTIYKETSTGGLAVNVPEC